jgi:hypothetical protein
MLDTRFVRLLSYENACKLIDYVRLKDKGTKDSDYAWITVGGVGMNLTDEARLLEVIEFLNGMNVRYEMSTQHPQDTEKEIVKDLKERGVIVTNDKN